MDKKGLPLQLQPDGTVIAPAAQARAEAASGGGDPMDETWTPMGFQILTAQPEVLRLGNLHNYQVGGARGGGKGTRGANW